MFLVEAGRTFFSLILFPSLPPFPPCCFLFSNKKKKTPHLLGIYCLLPPRVIMNKMGPLPTAAGRKWFWSHPYPCSLMMSLVSSTPTGEADGIAASSADNQFCALRVCRHPNRKDQPLHPAEDNHGNQDQPPPCCPEVSSIPAKSRQRKSHRDLQTNSWWQQITKGKLREHVSTA